MKSITYNVNYSARGKERGAIFEHVTSKNLPKWVEGIKTCFTKASFIFIKIKTKETISMHIIIKLETKEKNRNSQRNKDLFSSKGQLKT